MEWEPWEKDGLVKDLQIKDCIGPPCVHCRFWIPERNVRKTTEGQKYDGVTLCHAGDMYHDFSCFRDKNAPKETE